MSRAKRIILAVFISTLCVGLKQPVIAQVQFETKEVGDLRSMSRKANLLFEEYKYQRSAELYKELLRKYGENGPFNYKLGVCYYENVSKRGEAIEYLEKAIQSFNANTGDIPVEVFYYLAKSYQYLNQFDKAIVQYNKHMALARKEPGMGDLREEILKLIHRHIEECKYGLELQSEAKVDLTIENMGDQVNTEYPEYAPIFRSDGTLVFTSSRDLGTGSRRDRYGDFYEDVYFSFVEIMGPSTGKFQTETLGKFSSSINSRGHDSAIQFSKDGKRLFLYRKRGIWVSEYEAGRWRKPEKLKLAVPSRAQETSMALSADEKTLYLVSDWKGGYGGSDIYKSELTPDGLWGIPKNLGPEINTAYDEDALFLDKDGITLYFASKGHKGIGGFDLFKSTYNSAIGKWSVPENLGCPINSGADEVYFMKASNRERAYFSSNRSNGYGNMDIYRISYEKKMYDVASPEYQSALEIANKNLDSFQVLEESEKNMAEELEVKEVVIILDVTTDIDSVHRIVTASAERGGTGMPTIVVLFDYEGSNIDAQARKSLNVFYGFIKNHENLSFEVIGHSDSKGAKRHNLALSIERAKAVTNYLAGKGISPERLQPAGRGESEPIALNMNLDASYNLEGMRLNRRVEFKVLNPKDTSQIANE